MTSLSDLVSSFISESSMKDLDAQTGLETLEKIMLNVIANPEEEKYRRLKVNNPTIQTKVLAHPHAEEILTLFGFSRAINESNEEILTMGSESGDAEVARIVGRAVDDLNAVRDERQSALAALAKERRSREEDAVRSRMSEANTRITEDRKNLILAAKKKRADEERYKSELLAKIKEDSEARILKEARNRAALIASGGGFVVSKSPSISKGKISNSLATRLSTSRSKSTDESDTDSG